MCVVDVLSAHCVASYCGVLDVLLAHCVVSYCGVVDVLSAHCVASYLLIGRVLWYSGCAMARRVEIGEA